MTSERFRAEGVDVMGLVISAARGESGAATRE